MLRTSVGILEPAITFTKLVISSRNNIETKMQASEAT